MRKLACIFGNEYVTSVFRFAVHRINADDLTQETVAVLDLFDPTSPRLDTPNTIAFGTGKGGKQMLFVTNTHSVNNPAFSGRGLVKIDAEVPGRPLP